MLDTVGVKDPDTQTLINGILQIFNFGAAASAAFLVDRLGRRTLFLISAAGMLVSFVVWTACSAVFDSNASQAAGLTVVVFIFVYFYFYGKFIPDKQLIETNMILDIAYTPLLFGYPTEIFPFSLRAKGQHQKNTSFIKLNRLTFSRSHSRNDLNLRLSRHSLLRQPNRTRQDRMVRQTTFQHPPFAILIPRF